MPSIDEIADRPELARELAAPVARAMRWKALRALLALAMGEQDQEPTGTAIAPQPARILGIKETAARLNVSVDWLYKNGKELPFYRDIGGVGFYEPGLEDWLRKRRA